MKKGLKRPREECVDDVVLRTRPSEEDIDKFVEEYYSYYESPEEWIQCPLCHTGYVLMPVPGIVVCDHCSELQLSCSLAELATQLSFHATHQGVVFQVKDNVLFAHCPACQS